MTWDIHFDRCIRQQPGGIVWGILFGPFFLQYKLKKMKQTEIPPQYFNQNCNSQVFLE